MKILKKKAIEAKRKLPSERTYEDRFNIWADKKQNMIDDDTLWDEGEEIIIKDGEALASGKIEYPVKDIDFPDWFKEMGKHFGKKVEDMSGNIGTLIGMSYTYLDFYYIIEYPDGKVVGKSCVEKINIIED